MSTYMMREVIRISDRFNGRDNLDSIDRQGKLLSVAVAVLIFHAIMGIAFFKMEELERSHLPKSIASTVGVEFQVNSIPPEPVVNHDVTLPPPPPELTDGITHEQGGTASSAHEATKISTAPVTKVEDKDKVPSPLSSASVKTDFRKPVADPVVIPNATQAPLPSPQDAAPNTGNQSGAITISPPSGAPFDAGTISAVRDGHGSDNARTDGAGGSGVGPGREGAGSTDFPVGGPQIAVTPPVTDRVKMNIAPYRQQLLLAIAKEWRSAKGFDQMVIKLEIGREGELLSYAIRQPSRKAKWDREAIEAIQRADIPPLPEEYKGPSLFINLTLSAQ